MEMRSADIAGSQHDWWNNKNGRQAGAINPYRYTYLRKPFLTIKFARLVSSRRLVPEKTFNPATKILLHPVDGTRGQSQIGRGLEEGSFLSPAL